jgi:single-stranded-DNA-specific exonuclease
MKLKKRWEVGPEPDAATFQSLKEIPRPIVRALFHRGITDPDTTRAFFHSGPPPPADPFLMAGMDRAADRILQAVRSREPIVVYGDYDADGVTAAAMLVDFLKSIGAEASTYIPNRFEEGYGLNCPALKELSEKGARVVVSVDCGARSTSEADFARQLKLDLIISDHHAPGAVEPDCFAFLDPKRKTCAYPDKNLAGVGVAFRLVQAVAGRLPPDTPVHPDQYLDLVAIGTVADMVPLLGENRLLVQAGLDAINGPRQAALRPGVDQLIKIAGAARGSVDTHTIGFLLGPRLNASGRLDTATDALQLLLASDPVEARERAAALDSQNRERQGLTRATFLEAQKIILGSDGFDGAQPPWFLMAEKEGFNFGVIGLAASRLMDEYYRPSAVVAVEGDLARGSVRSVPGFQITEALDACSELLERFGGHAAAAGFTIRTDRLPELRRRLEKLAGDSLSSLDPHPILAVDSEVALPELSWGLLDWIRKLEPCGQGNPAPVFFSRGLTVAFKRAVGRENAHLKLTLTDGRSDFDAIAFGFGPQEKFLPARVDAAFQLEENNYSGRQLQLRIVDLQGGGLPAEG